MARTCSSVANSPRSAASIDEDYRGALLGGELDDRPIHTGKL
jgi:hypothetical protein